MFPTTTQRVLHDGVRNGLTALTHEFGPASSKAAFRNVIRRALKKSVPAFRANTHVRTGDLAKTIRVKVGLNRDRQTIVGGLGYAAEGGTNEYFAAIASEVGAGGRPPWGNAIVTTFAQEKEKIYAEVANNLTAEIQRQWARAAAKRSARP